MNFHNWLSFLFHFHSSSLCLFTLHLHYSSSIKKTRQPPIITSFLTLIFQTGESGFNATVSNKNTYPGKDLQFNNKINNKILCNFEFPLWLILWNNVAIAIVVGSGKNFFSDILILNRVGRSKRGNVISISKGPD